MRSWPAIGSVRLANIGSARDDLCAPSTPRKQPRSHRHCRLADRLARQTSGYRL